MTDIAADAELLTSEVVSNAVRYTDGMMTVLLAIVGRTLAVTVTDSNINGIAVDGAAPTPALPDPLDERGRGLFVLASIAGDWGITPSGHGKTVWFRLP